MDRLLQNLKIATAPCSASAPSRSLAAHILALGIGAATAIFNVGYGILLRPLPYPESERLVTLGQTAKG